MTPLEYILEKILPEVENAVVDSAKHQNRVYNIFLSLKEGSPNVDMKVTCVKHFPLLDLKTGLEAAISKVYREESVQTALAKAKLDVNKLLDSHSSDRGKTSVTITIKEGAYMSCEWLYTEFRYVSSKNTRVGNHRKHPSFQTR